MSPGPTGGLQQRLLTFADWWKQGPIHRIASTMVLTDSPSSLAQLWAEFMFDIGPADQQGNTRPLVRAQLIAPSFGCRIKRLLRHTREWHRCFQAARIRIETGIIRCDPDIEMIFTGKCPFALFERFAFVQGSADVSIRQSEPSCGQPQSKDRAMEVLQWGHLMP